MQTMNEPRAAQQRLTALLDAVNTAVAHPSRLEVVKSRDLEADLIALRGCPQLTGVDRAWSGGRYCATALCCDVWGDTEGGQFLIRLEDANFPA